ncbi:NagB/RpiA/CoA transferase-like superfamily protein [Zea mays]|uniref:NagB/RpiA/CoA transferase-like superfamily protein n=1 Tax=Zea mays TaxID=4577 RepID=A0A1D6GR73_MAIZE|nr:NagB/RpiA/CoA transferase-like superfamily protein [Zea mays]
MPDVQPLVSDFVLKLKRRKVEGSHAVARQTAELLRSVVSQHRMGSSANQAATLADAVRAVGEQLIAANPIVMMNMTANMMIALHYLLLFLLHMLEMPFVHLHCRLC